MYIYLLYYHNEDGPCELKATVCREKVVEILKSYEGVFDDIPYDRLNELLAKTDEELAAYEHSHWLHSDGWGGLGFHVVKSL